MFWKKNDGTKLPGPKELPDVIAKFLAAQKEIDPDSIPFLKEVRKPQENDPKVMSIRIYDPGDAEACKAQVKNYNDLNTNPGLIIAEGLFNEGTKKADLTIKKAMPKVKLLTLDEITQQIENLKDPGSSTFFYMSAGAAAGGPLGRGCSVVRMNKPEDEKGKKQKKYSIYAAAVVDMKPVAEEVKIWDSDKPKDIAKWLLDGQKPRFC